jgi:hypothetical protein
MHVTRNRAQRLLALDGRRHVYYIHEMGYDPKSTTTATTPLDPSIVYSQEDCPAEVDVDLRAKVLAAHVNFIHLAVWSRPDLAHAVSVLGRYVHNRSQKLWLAYHRIAKYLIRTNFRLVFGTNDPLRRTEPYGFTDSDWAADLDNRKSTGAYLFLLDGASCSWRVKLSPTVCLSTQQAEYYALSEGTKQHSSCASYFVTCASDRLSRQCSSATTKAPSPWHFTPPINRLHSPRRIWSPTS